MVCIVMTGRNDHNIDDALESRTHALQGQQNYQGVDDELCGLDKFQRHKLPTFKGRYDQEYVKA